MQIAFLQSLSSDVIRRATAERARLGSRQPGICLFGVPARGPPWDACNRGLFMVRAAHRKSPYTVVFYERYSLRSLPTREWQRVTIFTHVAPDRRYKLIKTGMQGRYIDNRFIAIMRAIMNEHVERVLESLHREKWGISISATISWLLKLPKSTPLKNILKYIS